MSVLRSEWTKLRSLPSTYITLGIALAISIAGGMVSAGHRANSYASLSPSDKASFDPTSLSYDGLSFAQVAFAVIGVLTISSEYGTGMIRTTLAAVPRRGRLLAAKLGLAGAAMLAVGLAFALSAFLLAQSMLAGKHLGAGLGDHLVLRSVLSAGLYLSLLTVFSLAVGAIVRHSAGAIAVVLSLLFAVPILGQAIDGWWNGPHKYCLFTIANSLVSTQSPGSQAPSYGTALLALLAYVLVAVTGAVVLIRHRDA